MKQAEDRHAELLIRREKRREKLERQKSLRLQSTESSNRIEGITVGPGRVECLGRGPNAERQKVSG